MTMDQHYLAPLLVPASIVVLGAAGGEAGGIADAIAGRLAADGFAGPVRRFDIDDPEPDRTGDESRADLAIVALPAPRLAEALERVGRLHCRSALLVSSGIEQAQAADLQALAQRHGVRLLGPNGLGFQRPALKLNASVAGPLAAAGPLGLISQSGSLTTAILDWARMNRVGFSSIVALGANPGDELAEVLDFLSTDAATRSIVIHLEGIHDARRFMSALRIAAHAKPVIVLKAGRKPAGSQAALTHSGAIVGADDAFDPALHRAGSVRVRSFVQLFSAAKCLASRYRPVGRRLAVITNGGGPGVLAADWIEQIRLEVGSLSADAVERLAPLLPPLASIGNLIDVSEDASPAQFAAAIEATGADADVDGLLVLYSPKLGGDPDGVAGAVIEAQRPIRKPVLACFLGDDRVVPARALLNAAQIPNFRTPEAAVDAFGNMATFHRNQQLLLQTPPRLSPLPDPDIEGARLLIESVLAARRNVLTEMESKALLSSFHIPVTQTILARSATEALMVANQLGYPVALKIDSPDISHKSDVGGVALDLANAAQVRDGFVEMMATVARNAPDARINGITVQNMAGKKHGREINIGLTTDVPFGPVIVFGAGGRMIELIADRAMELPPLNQYLARRLIERSRVAATLGDWHGAPAVDRVVLEHMLMRVSEMVCALPQLREMDINPIVVDANGAVAVDARVVVAATTSSTASGAASADRFSHLAILPYPSEYEQQWPLPGGDEYSLRPIRPDDAEMLQQFVRGMSPQSRYFRFASALNELSPRMLARYTLIDYDREMALIAVKPAPADAVGPVQPRMIGVSRYVINPDSISCEFSLAVSDDHAGRGVGSRLMHALVEVARDKGLIEMHGFVLSSNDTMLSLMKSLGFKSRAYPDDSSFRLVSLELQKAR
ncbi:GNAT family N-acetyltransferase [soil metagenome]